MGTETKSTHGRRNRSRFNPSKFIWLYDRGDVFDSNDLLYVDSLPVVHRATTIEQAKGAVRSDIRLMGGNAGMYLTVEKEATVKKSWAYDPPMYEVSAYAALVLPKDIDPEKREELLARLRGNVQYSKDLQGDTGTHESNISYYFMYTLSILLFAAFGIGILVALYNSGVLATIFWVMTSPIQCTSSFLFIWIFILIILYMAWDSISYKIFEFKHGKTPKLFDNKD